MPQVLTVGSESLAAGFATGDDYTRTAERNGRLSLDERAPNVPFKFGFCFRIFCLLRDSQAGFRAWEIPRPASRP